MDRPDGVVLRQDIAGVCDTCNADMPRSAAVVTRGAMRMLVEAGFWPVPPGSPADFIEQRTPGIRTIARRKYLREEYGDFAVCAACLARIDAHSIGSPPRG